MSNSMVAPSTVGDPLTSLYIDSERGYVLTGTGTGKVCAWPVHDLFGAAAGSPAATIGTAAQARGMEFYCVSLAAGSDEGIRALFVREGLIYALIGDLHVKIWSNYLNPSYQVRPSALRCACVGWSLGPRRQDRLAMRPLTNH